MTSPLQYALFVGVLALCQSVPAQEQSIKDLEPFIGEWSSDFKQEKGPSGVLQFSSRKAAINNCVLFSTSFTPKQEGAKPIHVVDLMVAKNPETGELHFWAFGADGRGEGKAVLDRKKLVFDGQGTSWKGKPTGRRVVYELTSEGLTVRQTDHHNDGKKMPDLTYKLKRDNE